VDAKPCFPLVDFARGSSSVAWSRSRRSCGGGSGGWQYPFAIPLRIFPATCPYRARGGSSTVLGKKGGKKEEKKRERGRAGLKSSESSNKDEFKNKKPSHTKCHFSSKAREMVETREIEVIVAVDDDSEPEENEVIVVLDDSIIVKRQNLYRWIVESSIPA
jgi:hypothetical protein